MISGLQCEHDLLCEHYSKGIDMTTTQLYAQECKQSQRKYMAMAKADRSFPEARKLAVDMALLNRKHAREWSGLPV